MSQKFKVKLTYTRHLEFEAEADSAYEAYTETRESFEYGDIRPEDEWSDTIELEEIHRGGLEIEIDHRYDWDAPKDERGLAQQLAVARDATNLREVDRDHDLRALLDRVFAESEEDAS